MGLKQHTYDEEARQDKYHPKTMKIEKQADKQVSVEAGEKRRNTTDVPTNFMFPACGNNIALLGKKSKCGCPEENVVRKNTNVGLPQPTRNRYLSVLSQTII